MAKIIHIGFLSSFFIVCTVIQCRAQFTVDAFYVQGQLVDSKTNEKIVFANVVNTKTMMGVISDSAGIFIILARPGDMLKISSLGYQPSFFTVNDSLKHVFNLQQIKLVEKIYEIKNVDIRFLGTYEQFKYRVLHTQTEDPLKKVNKDLQKSINSIPRMPTNDPPNIPLGVVSLIYNIFSKEGKQLRKLEEVMENAPAKKTIDERFNRQVLENITGLKGEELNEFALYCDLSDDFIIKATDYELYEKIIEYFERFKKRERDTTLKK